MARGSWIWQEKDKCDRDKVNTRDVKRQTLEDRPFKNLTVQQGDAGLKAETAF